LAAIDQGAGSSEALSEQDFLRGLYPMREQAKAFDLDRILIVGGRGAGKTQIFRALLNDEGRAAIARVTGVRLLYDLERALFVEGFAAGRFRRADAVQHPSADVLEEAIGGDFKTARKIWLGLSLGRIAAELAESRFESHVAAELQEVRAKVGSPRALLRWIDEDIERPFRLLDALDTELLAQRWVGIVTFDALDRAANDWATTEVAIAGLLSLALDLLRRYRALRLKVFLRPDLEEGSASRFPDASKLRGYREELSWGTEDLYRLVHKRMVAQADGGEESFAYLRSLGMADRFISDPILGRVPKSLGKEQQEEFMIRLVGRYMGASPSKGYSYRWVPNHLADARKEISPRSFLVAFAEAARWTRESRKHGQKGEAMVPAALFKGVEAASRQRVDELAEDFAWIRVVRQALSGLEVPCTEEKVIERLAQCQFEGTDRRSLPSTDPRAILAQLARLGVFFASGERRYNAPDLYRVAMAMKRRGGIKLVS
jgi:hypothetical protein